MVLGAVTCGTRREIEWITRDMGRLFPAEWEAFNAPVPPGERDGELSAAYGRMLADPDADVREAAARAWCAWEDTHVSLMPGWEPNPRYEDPTFRMVFARLVTRYWSHGCFLTDGQVLAGMDRLAGGSPPCSSTAAMTSPGRSTRPGHCTGTGPAVVSWSSRTPGTAEGASPTTSLPLWTPSPRSSRELLQGNPRDWSSSMRETTALGSAGQRCWSKTRTKVLRHCGWRVPGR